MQIKRFNNSSNLQNNLDATRGTNFIEMDMINAQMNTSKQMPIEVLPIQLAQQSAYNGHQI
jgi:hypothetical protein